MSHSGKILAGLQVWPQARVEARAAVVVGCDDSALVVGAGNCKENISSTVAFGNVIARINDIEAAYVAFVGQNSCGFCGCSSKTY